MFLLCLNTASSEELTRPPPELFRLIAFPRRDVSTGWKLRISFGPGKTIKNSNRCRPQGTRRLRGGSGDLLAERPATPQATVTVPREKRVSEHGFFAAIPTRCARPTPWVEMGLVMQKPKKPNKAYPNSDRFAEDGRALYSAYDAAKATAAAEAAKFAFVDAAKGKRPIPRVKLRRRLILIGGASLAAALGLLMYLISAG